MDRLRNSLRFQIYNGQQSISFDSDIYRTIILKGVCNVLAAYNVEASYLVPQQLDLHGNPKIEK